MGNSIRYRDTVLALTQAECVATPLLLTKLHQPSSRSHLVRRDRILQTLQQGLGSRLILVSAPAGFGKTTALGEWAQQTQQPVGWLALDERDNDPTRFWCYLVAALQKADRPLGEATLSMVQSPEPIPFEAFLTPLLNELAQLETDLILVLDDYHVITTPTIHEGLGFLLEHLPPGVRMAIATRTDPPLPLARWRVRSQLTELRSTDLRFSDAEATTFLQQSLPQSLTEAQVMTLQQQTEGWIAGLQLAMLSLRESASPTALIETFSGTQRYILDYLVEEVLNRQPPPVRQFLLRTAILEQLCGALCAAVMDEGVASGTQALEQLERQNLFVVPLDDERTWYRYHHLFAETLRHLLQRTEPDLVLGCHRRAAQWYEHQGYIADALHHAIAAQAFDYAAQMIEQEMQTSENPRLDAVVLSDALAALPSDLVQARPWLLAAKSWVGFTTSQFAEAVAVIEQMEQRLEENRSETENTYRLWGLVIALKGMKARQQGNNVESVAFMEKALQLLPQNYSWLRSLILLNLGVTYFVDDNYKAARQLLPEVSRIGRVRGAADPAIAGLYLQAQFLALRGQLTEATALCQQGLDLATERRWLPTYAGVLVQVALADLLRQQNQLDAAAYHLSQSIDRAIQNQQPGLMMGYITLARVRQAQGDLAAAWAAIRQAERCQVWLWPTILPVEACKARLYLVEGNVNAAIAWVESSGLTVDDGLDYNTTEKCPTAAELIYLTYARVLLAQGQQTASIPPLQAARRLLTRLQAQAQAGGRTPRLMETLLLQALAWQVQDERSRALACLHQALDIPHQDNDIRLFLDEGKAMADLLSCAASNRIQTKEVASLLALFEIQPKQKTAVVQPLVEPLSDRELEVLTYLATGMTNQAIANELFVSLAAVKWHARNIYGKLEVANRTQAVARARELGLLP
ncbi:LuxR family transcriptional regulator [Nodosilinea sp. LEGE 07298]|uniref:LuxR C-terminal-related transcriptional regulator n=1 Tax=Nodosilinea sp. LEGE 07298 TaxID=2777970 RepID=UPI001882FDB8|nr:LuxR C-terminal-related transcriptional regulator [Nodosilinea sp. LEGE 07298]MBE9109068.1 LuxR family transcriptional regulator [Nodosilinea sp. LEGE 07298]